MLLRRTNFPVVHLLGPLRLCRLQRTSCLTCCLFHQLVHATKKRMRRTKGGKPSIPEKIYALSGRICSLHLQKVKRWNDRHFSSLVYTNTLVCFVDRHGKVRQIDDTTPTEQHVPNISAQLRCVADMWDTPTSRYFVVQDAISSQTLIY